MIWQTGITTVPERSKTLLTRTLESLSAAGFDRSTIFMDGGGPVDFDNGCVVRHPSIGAFGNWTLGLTELFLRNPDADRYAMFEDDIVLCRNVRQYLEQCAFPTRGYLNLYTVPDNEATHPKLARGWGPSAQGGRGALALVFDREGVKALLSSMRMLDHAESKRRGHYLTDGAVLRSMRKVGREEWVHLPSLVQHVGVETTISDRLLPTLDKWQTAPSFPGEEHDAMEFLK